MKRFVLAALAAVALIGAGAPAISPVATAQALEYVHVGDCQGSLTGHPGDNDILIRMGQIDGYAWSWYLADNNGYRRYSNTILDIYVKIWNRHGPDWEPWVEETFRCYRASSGSIYDAYGSYYGGF